MRILLDTNLLVRAAITPNGLAKHLLSCIEARETHVLILSSHLLSEVADVLRRPRLQARWPLSDVEIETYCRYLTRVGQVVVLQALASPVISDPKDQAVIEAAISGRVEVICTSDAHFYNPPAKDFLTKRGISVLTDHALRLLFEKERDAGPHVDL